MRTRILHVIITVLITGTTFAQSMADVFNNSCTVTWIGIDYSAATFVPNYEFEAVEKNVSISLLKWNNLLESEHEKYNLATALGITHAVTNTVYVDAVNQNVTADALLSRTPRTLDKAKVPEMVAKYKTEEDTGVGVVFIVSSYNKTQEMAEYYVTFFNMRTKEVLHIERIYGEPTGFGIRNYWAGSVSHVLKTIEREYSTLWSKKFR